MNRTIFLSLCLGLVLLVAGCAVPPDPQTGPPDAEPLIRAEPAAGGNERAEAQSTGNLSLADAVALALRKNADLRVESLNSAMSAEDVKRSRAIYDPYVSASVSGGGTTEANRSGMNKNAGASLAVTQQLSTGASISVSGQTGFLVAREHEPGTPDFDYSSQVSVFITQPLLRNAGRQVTEVNIVLAKNSLQDALDRYRTFAADTVFSVVTTYNRLYALRQSLESRKASLDAARQLLETTKANAKAGTVRSIEVANAEYGVAFRLKDLVDAERYVRDQEASLRYLIGGEGKEEIIPSDPPTREEPQETEEQALQAALDLRPELKQLRLALQSSELQEQVSRNQTLPGVNLVVGGGLVGNNGTMGDNWQEMKDGQGWWSAGLQVTVPLGNTAAESDYRRSRIRGQQVRAQIAALSWRIRNDVQSDLRALISARLQIQVADKALAQALQRLGEYRESNRAGAATAQDVLNAEADLSAARSTHIDAIDGYASAVMKLWHDTGELLDQLGVKINTAKIENPPGTGEG
ncbi:MAG: TolC family protein [Deltaproteobacteria bacterium]|nr:TolC family protein [Deltaproteobacteria bacterium]